MGEGFLTKEVVVTTELANKHVGIRGGGGAHVA